MSDNPIQPILTKITIGDWSEDGHGKYNEFFFKVNYPVTTIRQAYKDSCAKTGVQFNHNENYINPNKGYIYDQIMTEYENSSIRPYETKILRQYGIIDDDKLESLKIDEDDDDTLYPEPKALAHIIMDFIALSMPEDFFYEIQELVAEPINGWWNPDLNVAFGYGLYE